MNSKVNYTSFVVDLRSEIRSVMLFALLFH
jgi:hypothetical protein